MSFHVSVPEELYEWLVQERKRRNVDKIQKVIRQILWEAKKAQEQAQKEADNHG